MFRTLSFRGTRTRLLPYALAAGLCLAIRSHATAQNVEVYNDTTVADKTSTELNVITDLPESLTLGFNQYLEEGEKPDTSAEATWNPNDRTNLYVFTRTNAASTRWEAKFNRVNERLSVDIGAGSDLFHTAVEYGDRSDIGGGLAYMNNEGDNLLRAELWKYLETPNLYIIGGAHNDSAQLVLLRPSQDGNSVQYFGTADFSNGRHVHRIKIGRSRDAYYSLNVIDAYFAVHDDTWIGSESVVAPRAPTRYIIPHLAWRLDGGKAWEVVYDSVGKLSLSNIFFLPDDQTWGKVGGSFDTSRDTGSVVVEAGRSGNVNALVGVEYILGNEAGNSDWSLSFRIRVPGR